MNMMRALKYTFIYGMNQSPLLKCKNILVYVLIDKVRNSVSVCPK